MKVNFKFFTTIFTLAMGSFFQTANAAFPSDFWIGRSYYSGGFMSSYPYGNDYSGSPDFGPQGSSGIGSYMLTYPYDLASDVTKFEARVYSNPVARTVYVNDEFGNPLYDYKEYDWEYAFSGEGYDQLIGSFEIADVPFQSTPINTSGLQFVSKSVPRSLSPSAIYLVNGTKTFIHTGAVLNGDGSVTEICFSYPSMELMIFQSDPTSGGIGISFTGSSSTGGVSYDPITGILSIYMNDATTVIGF